MTTPFCPQDISVRTKEILTNLVALADECEDSKITLEGLKQHHFPPVTENFLFHLAAAEQLLRIWCCFQSLCSEEIDSRLWLWSYAVDVGIIVASWKVALPYADNTPDACALKDGRADTCPSYQCVRLHRFCFVPTPSKPVPSDKMCTTSVITGWCTTRQPSTGCWLRRENKTGYIFKIYLYGKKNI